MKEIEVDTRTQVFVAGKGALDKMFSQILNPDPNCTCQSTRKFKRVGKDLLVEFRIES